MCDFLSNTKGLLQKSRNEKNFPHRVNPKNSVGQGAASVRLDSK